MYRVLFRWPGRSRWSTRVEWTSGNSRCTWSAGQPWSTVYGGLCTGRASTVSSVPSRSSRDSGRSGTTRKPRFPGRARPAWWSSYSRTARYFQKTAANATDFLGLPGPAGEPGPSGIPGPQVSSPLCGSYPLFRLGSARNSCRIGTRCTRTTRAARYVL